jgi:hypothetical protein
LGGKIVLGDYRLQITDYRLQNRGWRFEVRSSRLEEKNLQITDLGIEVVAEGVLQGRRACPLAGSDQTKKTFYTIMLVGEELQQGRMHRCGLKN